MYSQPIINGDKSQNRWELTYGSDDQLSAGFSLHNMPAWKIRLGCKNLTCLTSLLLDGALILSCSWWGNTVLECRERSTMKLQYVICYKLLQADLLHDSA